MAFINNFAFLTRFLYKLFIKTFVLFTCIIVCLLTILFHSVYICQASIDQPYGIYVLLEDKSCQVGRENLILFAPSEISCVHHCSGQLKYIGILYNSESGSCNCCSDIAEPTNISTEERKTHFFTISRSKGKPSDCGALVERETLTSGVYTVFPDGQNGTEVFCDFDDQDGPWTVIQRRIDDTVDFYLPYKSYQDGFGNLSGNFWLGLDTISTLTLHIGKNYSLKVIIVDTVNGVKFAKYTHFVVSDSSTGYKMFVQGYHGTAGDSLTYHQLCEFSTFDRDADNNEDGNCANRTTGAWWYGNCFLSSLNGKYGDVGTDKGITWVSTTGFNRSAEFSVMKLKERNYE